MLPPTSKFSSLHAIYYYYYCTRLQTRANNTTVATRCLKIVIAYVFFFFFFVYSFFYIIFTLFRIFKSRLLNKFKLFFKSQKVASEKYYRIRLFFYKEKILIFYGCLESSVCNFVVTENFRNITTTLKNVKKKKG